MIWFTLPSLYAICCVPDYIYYISLSPGGIPSGGVIVKVDIHVIRKQWLPNVMNPGRNPLHTKFHHLP
jgi:hypothetical protein